MFTTSVQYALTLLDQLNHEYPIPINQIAKEFNISRTLLQKVAHKLGQEGIIILKTGRRGGALLKPQRLSMLRLMRVFGQPRFSCTHEDSYNKFWYTELCNALDNMVVYESIFDEYKAEVHNVSFS